MQAPSEWMLLLAWCVVGSGGGEDCRFANHRTGDYRQHCCDPSRQGACQNPAALDGTHAGRGDSRIGGEVGIQPLGLTQDTAQPALLPSVETGEQKFAVVAPLEAQPYWSKLSCHKRQPSPPNCATGPGRGTARATRRAGRLSCNLWRQAAPRAARHQCQGTGSPQP